MERKPLPIGIEDFKRLIDDKYYFVDKTLMIKELIESQTIVGLFTRPRRFGKTLNMSMIQRFFEKTDESNAYLFDGLKISKYPECMKYQGQYPVISISLKSMKQATFEEAFAVFKDLIRAEILRHKSTLFNSAVIEETDLDKLTRFIELKADKSDYNTSIGFLSTLLASAYGKKVIILIDEYDVPLENAFHQGFYNDMVNLIRSVFESALKTNPSLDRAFLTGCLRVSKESIFTGLNNFKVLSIIDTRFDEQFGFTNEEVKQLLKSYDLESHFEETKEWYDGYRFGNADIYCPWDVVNHVDMLCADPKARPQSYWINTSGNGLVKRFIDKANKTTRDEIERLIAGEAIEKMLRLELTYDEIDNSIENLWSVLFTTGYLTQAGMTEEGAYKLVIPNREVRDVYKFQIQEWFRETIFSNTEQLTAFWNAVEGGRIEVIEKYLNRTLSNSISVFDTKAPEKEKENSYHTFLVGLLVGNADWLVRSNVEAGEGFADIVVETEDPDAGIIFELKCSKDAKGLENACQRAMEQIKDRRYTEYLKNDGRDDILIYGIAFYKKRCKVVVEKI